MKRVGIILGSLLAVALAVFSMQSMAAETQASGRDFNHMSTGFMLSGGHAIAACESCHIGGVFKGTPRACDGCHALGKRIIATPKSSAHIVTDAPCDSCHFNASTFYGARFNHATALPGQCRTCHNGRLSQDKPVSHNPTTNKGTQSCDQCHRSVAWLPATWNHTADSVGRCSTCHNGTTAPGKRHTPATTIKETYQCDECHNYLGWLPARYKHIGAVDCASCHNGSTAVGKSAGHVATIDQCSQCHTGTTTWAGALGAKPANHIPYNAGVFCSNCHTGLAKVPVNTLHAYSVATYTCFDCHIKPNPYTGNNQSTKSTHEGSSGNNCTTACHEHSKAVNYSGW
jgi:hypothetical protein